ncbi:BMP family ABC transporter substrate-binding protein [Dorea sp. OM02-2LB]|nr:BMP family ABC transporter substrate-binding protein [Dorea sp. OM02-2LB]RGV95659.1 BMP family ABC transporter substrate-binding protein [Ruminococcus sp. AF14-10]
MEDQKGGEEMSLDDYKKARKLAQRQSRRASTKGESPYLKVLDTILEKQETAGNQYLGMMEIPLSLVIGTKETGRSIAFSPDFLPLLDETSEFATKWLSLFQSQMEEGLRDPVTVYEYRNRFYVQEGNKRVSIMKYLKMPTILANVTRILPVHDSKKENVVYYEFVEFYKRTGLNMIIFPEPGNYESLLQAIGKDWNSKWNEEEIRRLSSVFYHFGIMYESMTGDFIPEHIGTAFLRCLEIFPYEELKEKTSVEICEKLEIIREEIEPEALEAEVERVMEPETEKTPILTRLLASPKRMIKVAFIYEGSTNSSEWNYAHELGRQQLEDSFSGRVITSVYENIQPQTPRSEVLETAIEDGNAVIFTTTATLMQASVQTALKHPEIYIFNCSLNFPYKSVRTYLTRNYEMKFLLGLIAGAAADRECVIGYEEDYPMYGTIANINAFSIGVQMMQPGARVKLIWTGVKNSKSEEEKKKLRIISAKEMISKKGTESPYGLYFQENGEITRIATSIINWGKFYERIMQYILDGSWKPMAYGDKKTLNYWWGLSAGVVELICSERVPGGVKRMAESFAQFIAEGSFHPFEGKMRDQNGKIHGIDGETLEVEELVTMDWLYENVIGRIPEQSELEEGARELLKLQGL